MARTVQTDGGEAAGGGSPAETGLRRPAMSQALSAPESVPGARNLDAAAHLAAARITGGLSPVSLALAGMDWWMHLGGSPGKCAELGVAAVQEGAALFADMLSGETETTDRRFADAGWKQPPYRQLAATHLAAERWWQRATTGVSGVSAKHEAFVSFAARQWVDMFSPGNFFWTNPEAAAATFEQQGANLMRGADRLMRDALSQSGGSEGQFQVGRDVAATPGEVVFRNELIELIRYDPMTSEVHPEPVLFVPAWIMKYYILDLSARNSLVRYLLEHGHQVFMISWRNPDPSMRDVGFDDYRRLGMMAALDVVAQAVPDSKVHVAGYCLGGTLATIGAAAMARDGDDRLAGLTLFAAQTDFTEAGELTMFIDESDVAFLEDAMAQQGYLDSTQMAGAFQLLRANDLVWSQMIRHYMLGLEDVPNDLMAWNADATRMPARMHAEYLRGLFLRNDLAQGRHLVGGRPVELADIRVPVFAVGTETDHVAPWRSVYKIDHLAGGEVTFLLTTGGHNAGIVNPPGTNRRAWRARCRAVGDLHLDPESWLAACEPQSGSWWPVWQQWLAERSAPVTARTDENPLPDLGPAPGTYVLQQ